VRLASEAGFRPEAEIGPDSRDVRIYNGGKVDSWRRPAPGAPLEVTWRDDSWIWHDWRNWRNEEVVEPDVQWRLADYDPATVFLVSYRPGSLPALKGFLKRLLGRYGGWVADDAGSPPFDVESVDNLEYHWVSLAEIEGRWWWNPAARLGPDKQGRYRYLGDPSSLSHARTCSGHPIRSQADLQVLTPILREDRAGSAAKPQTYVVTVEGIFRLGGYLNEHIEVAGGEPVMAAGEAVLEQRPDGAWRTASLNNRSYGYMPDPTSWAAVDRALATTGVEYPRAGFSEVYPMEGTWAKVLAVLLQ
jgi:hypothetical protein